MNLHQISALAVSSSAMVVVLPNVESSLADAPTPHVIRTNETASDWSPPKIEAPETEPTIRVPIAEHWNVGKNAEFRKLAEKEALGNLTPEEALELDSLTRLRRQKNYPRTADEILWHRRQQKLTRGLLEALKDYVEFHET
jgi:hypothetical protein